MPPAKRSGERTATEQGNEPFSTTPLPTLHDVLVRLNLSQYHSGFLEAGVAETGIHRILQLNEAELKTFLDSSPLPPFHKIVFRRGVRELRDALPASQVHATSPPALPPSGQPSATTPHTFLHADIVMQATVYGSELNPVYGSLNRELTAYEQAFNETSIMLALVNPELLQDRRALIGQTKTRLLETYTIYKCGKIHLKTPRTNRVARAAFAQTQSDARQTRIQALQWAIRTGSTDMGQKAELSRLRLQERKYKWYMKRKAP